MLLLLFSPVSRFSCAMSLCSLHENNLIYLGSGRRQKVHFNCIWKAAVCWNKREQKKLQPGEKQRALIRILGRERCGGEETSPPSMTPLFANDILYGNLIIDWIDEKIFLWLLLYNFVPKIKQQEAKFISQEKKKLTLNSYSCKSMEVKLVLWCNISNLSYLCCLPSYCFSRGEFIT